ncbi:hypothetical protein ACWD04_04425 [Streptomyces sp. NPDC002911]
MEEPSTPGDMPFAWAARYIDRLTGIEERTREDYSRDLRIHFTLLRHTTLQGRSVPATIGNLTEDDITDWVRAEEAGEPDPTVESKWLRRPADPKSIANRRGLLYCIVQAAIDSTPQPRTTNCCKRTSSPRTDDHTTEEMTFLEREEYQRIRRRDHRPGSPGTGRLAGRHGHAVGRAGLGHWPHIADTAPLHPDAVGEAVSCDKPSSCRRAAIL